MTPLRTGSVAVLLLTVFVDSFGFAVIMPVTPFLVKTLSHSGPSAASLWLSLLFSSYSLTLFFCAPLIGRLSDQFGRRRVILVALAIGIAEYLVSATAGSLWLLLAMRVVAGACGGDTSVASAYIADASAPDKRAQNFGLLGAALGLGLIAGPAVGGWLAGLGPRAPFWASAALAAVNLALAWIVLPESLGLAERRKFTWRGTGPFGLFRAGYPRIVIGLLFAFFFMQLAQAAVQTVFVVFVDLKFGWSQNRVGLCLTLLGVSTAVAQTLLIRLFTRFLGARGAVLLGYGFAIASLAAFSVIGQGWQVYAVILAWAVAMVAEPAARGIMSNEVAPSAQGQLQGLTTGLGGLAWVFGPITGAAVFRSFTRDGTALFAPGATFALCALFCAVALASAAYAFRRPAAPQADALSAG